MSSKHPPLTYREVTRGLKNLGFTPRKKTGTSHEQWVKIVAGRIYKVTVDAPKQPFTHDLVKSMASQAGVSKDQFYDACLK
jgi:predicted RNA binding protein YcfA (HicA-like mRNA interferase family)